MCLHKIIVTYAACNNIYRVILVKDISQRFTLELNIKLSCIFRLAMTMRHTTLLHNACLTSVKPLTTNNTLTWNRVFVMERFLKKRYYKYDAKHY